MGLLRRLGRGAGMARRFMDEGQGALNASVAGMTAGGLLGGTGGLLANLPRDDGSENLDQYANRLLSGIGTGAALGAAGVGGLHLAQGARGFVRGFARNLDDMKEEALQYVRGHPPTQHRVMMAQSAEEVEQIVQQFVSTSRVRGPMGG